MSDGLYADVTLQRGDFRMRAAFAVPPGLTVLLGPSGAGKSLTLQAIAGLVPLTSGQVTLDGRTLADAAAGVALPPQARRLGYVPQSYALFPHLSVAENIAYALPRPPWPGLPWLGRASAWRAARARRVAEMLALVRLPGFAARRPPSLSGGEAQRVALARALAAAPRALLLDEPLSALDAPTRAALQDDLRAVVLAAGVPALVVTHDLAEARALADRLVLLLLRGAVVAEGTVAEVLAAPPSAEAALLLGWRNVLPIARCEVAGDRARITLCGGQVVSVPARAAPPAPAGAPQALALRADRLALVPAAEDDAAEDDAAEGGAEAPLRCVLRRVTDMGAYYLIAVALDGTHEGAPEGVSPLVLTCSPREWSALGLAPGAPVGVRVPAGAARLVISHPMDEGGEHER